MLAIKKAASAETLTVAAYVRRAIYRAAGLIR